jgi:L-histidine Nalpha-methyltransferase
MPAVQSVADGGAARFATAVCAGLSKPQKELPCEYLYDELGSALFEAITMLPEYGLTRADCRVVAKLAREIPKSYAWIVELGSGSGKKTRPLLEALRPSVYTAIDVSPAALARCGVELGAYAKFQPICARYLDGLCQVVMRRAPDERLLLLFLGSTIGNFDPSARADFLEQLRGLLSHGDALLIGFDLIKPLKAMLAAYDDPTGVTASFNLNLLARINRELGAVFELRNFLHHARYSRAEQRIEMHLRSRAAQSVEIPAAGFTCSLRRGETIWTESSHKFRSSQIPEMARAAGFVHDRMWVDDCWPLAESLWLA